MKSPVVKEPVHSLAAKQRHPAPVREMYFNSRDYAAACARVHTKRTLFDKAAK